MRLLVIGDHPSAVNLREQFRNPAVNWTVHSKFPNLVIEVVTGTLAVPEVEVTNAQLVSLFLNQINEQGIGLVYLRKSENLLKLKVGIPKALTEEQTISVEKAIFRTALLFAPQVTISFFRTLKLWFQANFG